MAASWVTETKEKENYTKLCRLLYDGGTLAVRTEFDGKCPPTALATSLNSNKPILQHLKRPTGRVLSQDQWDVLYPPSGASPKSDDFDITLLFVLLRNICGLTPPATGWDALPPSADTSLEANLVRIKYYRNNVTAHSSKAEVDDTLFKNYWSEISDSLVSLGLKQDDIDKLKSSPLGAKDYNQLVEYWDLSDGEIKHQLNVMDSKLSDLQSRMPSAQVESEISKLAHIDFTSLIQRSCKIYHQSTRQWILKQVEKNVQKASSGASVLLISAGPGMGKSIVAAKICDIYQKGGFLGGCHFFQHSNSLRNNPRMMLQSIARQLCNSLTGYQAALETKLKSLQERKISDLSCEELFTILLEEPLSQICIDHNVVIVIDALDECASKFKEEFEDVLKRKLSLLPKCIQLVITTRPLPSCRNLSPIVQIEINPSDPENVWDLREFFTFKLQAKRNAQNSIEKLMEIASGSFLVAHFVLEILDENEYETVADILACFPHGLSSVYEYYFKRIHELIKPYFRTSDNEDDNFFKMLEAMVATESPIPKELFYDILCLKSENEVQRAKRKERNVAVHLLHTIFPVENDHVSVFHKTVTDWLNLVDGNEHEFRVTESNGCEVLAQKSLGVLKAFKKAVEEEEKPFNQPLVLSDSETFALRFGLKYVNKNSKLSQTEKDEIIKDFIIMAAILSSFNDNIPDIFDLLDSLYSDVKKLFFQIYYCIFSYNSTSVFLKRKQFEEIVSDNKIVPFGQCLSAVCDANLIKDILPTEQKKKLLSLLIKCKLPYYSLHPVVSSLPSALQHQSSSSFFDLFDITNGFIGVNVDPVSEPPTSTVLNIKDDGSFGEDKIFVSSDVRGVSPDKKFLIITKTNSSKIELFDVTTLEKVREYNCTISCVDSCHIFGDEQWYIVVKAQGDPKIHILDGLNGQLHDTIEVGEDEKIEGVSQCGHILISHNIVISTTVDDDEDTIEVEIMFFKTIHFRNKDVKIYYYPPEVDNLHDGGWKTEDLVNDNFKFSDDGKYLSLHSDEKGHIFHTNDGTLYRTVKYERWIGRKREILLSFSCLVLRSKVLFDRCMLIFYDLLNSKVMYAAAMKLTKESRLLLPPQHHTDKSIPKTVFALNRNELVKYEFHNLELNL